MNRHVVVTGSSTGIGRACVMHLASRGWVVHAGVRKPSDAQSLERERGAAVRSVILDVTDAASIAAAAEEIAQRVGNEGLAGLVNNAGMGVNGPVELVPIDGWRRQF